MARRTELVGTSQGLWSVMMGYGEPGSNPSGFQSPDVRLVRSGPSVPLTSQARDAQRPIYPANGGATVADARLVSRPSKMRGSLPLPPMTQLSVDIRSGLVVFAVPAGVQTVELIWLHSDTDSIAMLSDAG